MYFSANAKNYDRFYAVYVIQMKIAPYRFFLKHNELHNTPFHFAH